MALTDEAPVELADAWLTALSQFLGSGTTRKLSRATVQDGYVHAGIHQDRNTRRIGFGSRVRIRHRAGVLYGEVERFFSEGGQRVLVVKVQREEGSASRSP